MEIKAPRCPLAYCAAMLHLTRPIHFIAAGAAFLALIMLASFLIAHITG